MLKSKISRRLIFPFLCVIIISLSLLGFYLLHFFYNENIQRKTSELTVNTKIIKAFIEDAQKTSSDDKIAAKIQEFSTAANLRITYLNVDGKVLADSSEPAERLDNHLGRQEVQAALEAGFGSSSRYSDTLKENMLYVALPIRESTGQITGIVRMASSLAPIENSYVHTRRTIISALFISTLITILLGLLLAQRQIRPIRQMTADAREITNGNLEKRLHIRTEDELEILANTINSLTTNLAKKIKEFRSENHKLTLILENMDNAVMLLNAQGNITTANKEACRLFRLTPDLLQKHSINAIGSALLSDTAQEVLQSGTTKSINFHIISNGTRKTFAVFFAPCFEEDSHVVLSVFHDISILQDLSDRQSTFVTNAAHELATPLTSICGFSETLLDSELDDPVLARKFIDIIHNESQRMNRLIKDLLQLAKLDSKQYREQLQLQTIDCRQLLTAAASQLEPQINSKNQTLSLHLPENRAELLANEDLLLQLILNLLENAIKYTKTNGQIELRCQVDDTQIEIRIKDNGLGIAPADLPFIFERFYRADKSRLRTFGCGGSGIGLSLVQFLVQMFGGKIHVESELDVGTEFIIEFPRVHEQ
jgi:two-component system phosphate regulon sensor histidine kinase PhoR